MGFTNCQESVTRKKIKLSLSFAHAAEVAEWYGSVLWEVPVSFLTQVALS